MIRRRLLGAVLVLPVLCAAGCGCRPTPASPASSTPASPITPPTAVEKAPDKVAAPASESHAPSKITAKISVVSLDGEALAGMQPIVTRQPNAFDDPLSAGEPTNAGGVSTFSFAGTEKVYLRAWDPTLAYFPNNYLEIQPSADDAVAEGQIMMAKSAAMHGMFLKPDGAPAAAEEIRMMMFHPTLGPWWPDRATTAADGVVEFPRVPPGKFTIQFEAASGRFRFESVTLIPGGVLDLAAVRLEP